MQCGIVPSCFVRYGTLVKDLWVCREVHQVERPDEVNVTSKRKREREKDEGSEESASSDAEKEDDIEVEEEGDEEAGQGLPGKISGASCRAESTSGISSDLGYKKDVFLNMEVLRGYQHKVSLHPSIWLWSYCNALLKKRR